MATSSGSLQIRASLALLLVILTAFSVAAQSFTQLATVDTGSQPKQVVFSPDGTRLIVTLLNGGGIDVVSLASATVRHVTVPRFGDSRGFVEAVFHPDGARLYVSQMTTGLIHEFTARGAYVRSFPTGGEWSKVIAISPDGTVMAVSNWLSDSVTILDTADGDIVHRILLPGATIPRGLAFTPDGASLLIAYYGSGQFVRVSTSDWDVVASLQTGGAARHIAVHPSGQVAYVSDMLHRRVLVVSLQDNEIVTSVAVGSNPNTIALSPDGALLYVSCRGPNNPDGYELRSPEAGAIHVISTESLRTLRVIAGGNQPTGLAVSADGTRFAFTNFQDDTVEVYRVVQ